MTEAEKIARLIVARHTPRPAQLDEDGRETGQMCSGHHGYGYPPAWPCQLHILADALLRALGGTDA